VELPWYDRPDELLWRRIEAYSRGYLSDIAIYSSRLPAGIE